MKAHTAILSAVILSVFNSVVECRSDWQILNGTRDMQDGKDDTKNQLQFNYYSELDEDTNTNNLYGTF